MKDITITLLFIGFLSVLALSTYRNQQHKEMKEVAILRDSLENNISVLEEDLNTEKLINLTLRNYINDSEERKLQRDTNYLKLLER